MAVPTAATGTIDKDARRLKTSANAPTAGGAPRKPTRDTRETTATPAPGATPGTLASYLERHRKERARADTRQGEAEDRPLCLTDQQNQREGDADQPGTVLDDVPGANAIDYSVAHETASRHRRGEGYEAKAGDAGACREVTRQVHRAPRGGHVLDDRGKEGDSSNDE